MEYTLLVVAIKLVDRLVWRAGQRARIGPGATRSAIPATRIPPANVPLQPQVAMIASADVGASGCQAAHFHLFFSIRSCHFRNRSPLSTRPAC